MPVDTGGFDHLQSGDLHARFYLFMEIELENFRKIDYKFWRTRRINCKLVKTTRAAIAWPGCIETARSQTYVRSQVDGLDTSVVA